MTTLAALAALAGLAAACMLLLTILRVIGEVMNEWAGVRADERVPPADHPYEPNGGPHGAAPTFPAAVLYALPQTASPRLNGTLPGRRKDNTDDRTADPSTLSN